MKLFLRQVKALVRLAFLELWRRNDVFGLLVLGVALMVPLSMASIISSMVMILVILAGKPGSLAFFS